MNRTLLSLALILGSSSLVGLASADEPQDEDALVRVTQPLKREDLQKLRGLRPDRLKPGGGLFVSFDENIDGQVDLAEIETGIAAAFEAADTSENGTLSVLEQQVWAEGLSTADTSLANPVRFDPNLDRQISFEEFESVIQDLANDYMKEDAEYILVEDLEIEQPERVDEDQVDDLRERARRNGLPGRDRNNSSLD
ncbi:MAG: EF-hand domain-containing protein [Pseudomonadota bacterium]